ncbi:unnamed protein product [Blepharisma stoltei]|uniref:Uncharacterized protein n=1 Tax=Blepharisma stoltei TaxID=1481888 RepID=A0AAU9IW31_9CILI|nr:unnamed protein product [Blepharisma stoltei]
MDTLYLTYLGIFLSFILCVSPFPNMIRRAKDNEMHYVPIHFLWVNHSTRMTWLCYGILKEIVPFITNCVMTGLASILMLILYYFFTRSFAKFIALYVLFLTGLFGLSFWILPVDWVGNLAATLGTLTYISTARNLRTALVTLNLKLIDLPITCVALCNSLAWASYGLVIMDFPLIIGCSIGVIVSITLLVSYAWIRCSRLKKNND